MSALRTRITAACGVASMMVLSGCGQQQSLFAIATASATTSSSAASESTKTCTREQEAANKKVAVTFASLRETPEKSFDLIHPDYIQHNAMFLQFGKVNGASGKQVMTELVPMLQRSGLDMPSPPLPDPKKPKDNDLYMVTVDCDVVTVISQHYRPDPVHQGEYYADYFFDVWRIKDGKLYEHWDSVQMPKPLPEFVKTPLKDLLAKRPKSSGG